MKLILDPASCKPVSVVSHTPPSPHNDITSSSERSTLITTQPCRARTRDRCGCHHSKARRALSVVLCWAATVVSSSRLSPYTSAAISSFTVCMSPKVCTCFAHYVSRVRFLFPSCSVANNAFRPAHARVLAADGNQCRVKGCRTAVRAKFSEGPRAVRTRYYSNSSRGLPIQRTPPVSSF